MSVLKGVLKAINNPYATIAKDGLICGDISGYVDTGVYTLNALVSGDLRGGFPKGKVVALAGEKGVGKSFILLKALKEYLNSDSENEVIFFESEGALNQDLLVDRGIDIDRVSIIPVSTVEEFRHQVLVALDYIEDIWNQTGEHSKVLMCLDSLGMLGTDHEVNTSRTNDNKADMGKRAQLIKSVFRNVTLKLSLLQIPMIITNHTYKGMGQYDPTKMSGGQGLEFAASIIIFISKSGVKDPKEKLKKLMGNNLTFIVHKGRMTIEGSRAVVGLDFKGGIGRYNGLVDMFIKAKIFNKSGAWFTWGEEKIGHGEKQVYENLPNFINDDLINELQPYIEKTFCYGAYVDPDIPQNTTKEKDDVK